MVPGRCLCGSAVLAAMAMLAPSRAALSAMARPMPRLAPVMKRVLPARLIAFAPSGSDGAVPVDAGAVAAPLGAAATHQAVEKRQALAGRHAQHLLGDLALEEHVKHVDRPLRLCDQPFQPLQRALVVVDQLVEARVQAEERVVVGR